jgi:hypothetical protein
MRMPDWLNWLAATTGIFGFCFSIWVWVRESRTRARLEHASIDLNAATSEFQKNKSELEEAQRGLQAAAGALDRRLQHLEKMRTYAGATSSLQAGQLV